MTKSLTYVEIDVPAWSQSSPDSPPNELTFRFAVDTNYLPTEISCIPSIKSVTISPGIVGLGTDLGQRASVTVTFKDHRHIFAGESFFGGTFWGKWRARYGLTLRGHEFRLIRGVLGQTLAQMETRTYAVESSDGPNSTGEYKIIAKDILKITDGDRAQAPLLSGGSLSGALTNVGTSAALSPTGIGAEYDAAGYVAIGGNEIASYTRVGDLLTLTRGLFNTVAVAHDAGDRVQQCLDLTAGATVSTIIALLLNNYTDVPAGAIPIAEWDAEVAGHLNVNFSALITEPTSVNKLIAELIEQAGLAMWWDDVTQTIKLQVLRAVVGAQTIDMEVIIADSLEITEQPDKRLSQVYVFFGRINPLLKEDQIENYRSSVIRQDTFAESEYGTPAIKKIFSRWIPAGGASTAQLIANKHLGRYRDPPRRFSFDLLRYAQTDPQLGAGYGLASWQLQDTSGNAATVPIQIFKVNPGADKFEIEAEEMLWTPYGGDVDPGTKAIIFDAHEANVNLRARHDQLYPAPQSGQTINAYVNENIIIYSNSTAIPALDIGTWPGGVTVNVYVLGWVRGHGGAGGNGGSLSPGPTSTPGGAGTQGGTAIYTRQAINLTYTIGAIWGGGGGGGGGGSYAIGPNIEVAGSGGGGGAGHAAGIPGIGGTATIGFIAQVNGVDGAYQTDPETGGVGGNSGFSVNSSQPGGNGGNVGLAGSAGADPTSPGQPGGAGGAAGFAIDGVSFVTVVGAAGDLRGGQVN